MHRTARLCSVSKQAPSGYCYHTDVYGTVFLPEGHPLRYDNATVVREYFWGASTNPSSVAAGICTECASRQGATIVNDEREVLVGYANRAISDANRLLNSGLLDDQDVSRLTGARNALQTAMDDGSGPDLLRTLISTLKRLNQAAMEKYGF